MKLQDWNVPKGFAAVRKVLAVDANESFHSLTATGDGILPEINISLATIFTCLLLPIPKMTFRFPMLERASRHDMLSFLHTFSL